MSGGAAGEPAAGGVSSWLAQLPPLLWPGSPAPDQDGPEPLTLGSLLRIFEKVATGIPDGVSLLHSTTDAPGGTTTAGHEHLALTDQIAGLHRIFDPWTTPQELLPWLASWVALDFPTLQGQPLWDEYQRRKVTAEIARIYRLRGRREGMRQYLDLYAVGQARPRVAVDDGGRLLCVFPRPGARAEVSALVSQGPVVVGTQVRSEGLTRPWGVTADGDGNLAVADLGLPDSAPVRLPNRVWQLDRAGRYPLAGTPPRPAPLTVDPAALKDVVAVTVRPARGAAPATLYVLTRPGRLYAVPAPFQGIPATLVTTLSVAGTGVWMIAITTDPATGDLLVLDRGGRPPQVPKPVVIQVGPDPLAVTRTSLTTVLEPLCLLADPDGTLLVGDGREQAPATPGQFPGNLVRVDRSAATWTETLLLPRDQQINPLISPTGAARLGGLLYVLDAGVKPFTPSSARPFICPAAEPARVYQVDLAAAVPELTAVTSPGEFVYPTGMVATGDHLVVADPGQPETPGLEPYWGRVRPFQFDVSIHFTDSRLPASTAERRQVLRQATGNISAIITEQKPAHTLWTLITSIL